MTGCSSDGIDVAVAHWHINAWGGAEYLVTHLAEALGKDTVYTLGSPSPENPNPYGGVTFADVLPSLSLTALRRLQNRFGRAFEYALWEDVDWRDFGDPDVLITSGATTRAVITPDDTLHVNYCHSPPRWFYDLYHDRKDSVVGIVNRPLVRYLRTRDVAIDPRVDHYFANSPVVSRRLHKYYNRDCEVLCPPVDLTSCYDRGDSGYYLHLGRLDEEKGVPAIVDAFIGTEYKLVFAGGEGDVGTSVRKKISGADNIEYHGFVSETKKFELLADCRALVFNGNNEDFGIVPVEANASNKPCLVPDSGFPGLYVEDGRNGYKHDGTIAGISACLERFEREGLTGDPESFARQYGFDTFKNRLTTVVQDWYRSFENQAQTTGI